MGLVMIGACAVVVASLGLPWIAADPEFSQTREITELRGLEYGNGYVSAIAAALLGLYGWQGIARERVRFNVAALFGVLTLVTVTWLGTLIADAELLVQLNADPAPGSSPFGEEYVNPDAIDRQLGMDLAFFASLVTIIPLTMLWRDDRRRRQEQRPAPQTRAEGAPPPHATQAPREPQRAAAPAGWYADPMSRHERRFFDGSRWSEHVVDGEVQSTDPVA